MTETEYRSLELGIYSLSVFAEDFGACEYDYADSISLYNIIFSRNLPELHNRLEACARTARILARYGCSLSEYIWRRVCESENEYVRCVAGGRTVPDALKANANADLDALSAMTGHTPAELFVLEDYGGYVPQFENEKLDLRAMYDERLRNISKVGFGKFATATMFRVGDDGKIEPVASADTITPDAFVGYEAQRQRVYDNTRALVEGRPAANILLFGDAGTGKSSTVKSAANMFANDGVRLIELRRDQLLELHRVMGKIADSPLKFIIFIDDLSFSKNDDSFSMLKAALEGSASAKAKNAVIYATSNRRHIVKETFSERGNSLDADDIHKNDTAQELLSLSDRFGMTVYFERPNKALYLDIVHTLAKRAGIEVNGELDVKAETFALSRASRSPRAAEQFINSLL